MLRPAFIGLVPLRVGSSSAAGNSCGAIKVWGSTSSLARNQASIVKANLEQIGCTVELVLMPRAEQFGKAKIRGADYDATIEAWGADYPDPSDFLNTFFDGTTIGPSGNNNYAYFDNPDINAKLAAANQLSGAARYDAYGKLDVEIMTDHAPIVPFLTRDNRFFNSARVRGFVYQPALQIVDLNTFSIK